jgi:dynein heavy chain
MLVTSLMRWISALLSPIETESNKKIQEAWIRGLFVFCLVWSLGATVDDAGRAIFSERLAALVKSGGEAPPTARPVSGAVTGPPHGHGHGHGHGAALDLTTQALLKFEQPLPDEGSCYDYLFELKGKGKWVKWMFTVEGEMTLKPNQKLRDAIVPTTDTARYTYARGVQTNLIFFTAATNLFIFTCEGFSWMWLSATTYR